MPKSGFSPIIRMLQTEIDAGKANFLNNFDIIVTDAEGNDTGKKYNSGMVGATPEPISTAPHWHSPPALNKEAVSWTLTANQVWDISGKLDAAGVPLNADIIFLAWAPSRISDFMKFEMLAADDTVLGTIQFTADYSDLVYGISAPPPGSMVPCPGLTRKLKYEGHGGHTHNYTNPSRFVSVYGWQMSNGH